MENGGGRVEVGSSVLTSRFFVLGLMGRALLSTNDIHDA